MFQREKLEEMNYPEQKCDWVARKFLAIDDIMRNKHKHFGNLALWDKESTGKPCQ